MATGRIPTTANSPLTVKGDLFGYSTTQARVPVGNDGETLVADSSTTTGLRYQGNYAAGKNLVLNGDFGIWQRGTSFTSTNGTGFFGPDRFNIYSATTGRTFSRQNTGPNGSSYFIRMQRNSGNTNTSEISIFYTLETLQSKPLAGKTLTLSFYARAGANFSAASSTMFSPAVYGTGTDQNQIAGFTGSASIANQGNVLTTSWQRFTMTGTVNAAATQVGFQLVYTPVGTAGAADYMDIADVQWEVGSVATAFQTATGTLQGELAACQRYYSVIATGNSQPFAMGAYFRTDQININVPLPVQMRIAPVLSVVSGTNYYQAQLNNTQDGLNDFVLAAASPLAAWIYQAGATVNGVINAAALMNTNNAAAFIAFSSEL